MRKIISLGKQKVKNQISPSCLRQPHNFTQIYGRADGADGDNAAGRRYGVPRQDDQDRWERGKKRERAEGMAAQRDDEGEVRGSGVGGGGVGY